MLAGEKIPDTNKETNEIPEPHESVNTEIPENTNPLTTLTLTIIFF